jgi:isopentenyl-diphosphate delta-isomerase
MEEQLVLVDGNDNAIGVAEKTKVHRDGSLHRAFSIFIFDSTGNLLLQKRAQTKYHSGNLWSNTCCGHPRPSELTKDAARRRLAEEMGFDCELEEIFSFIYHVKIDDKLYEHEFDHVFRGRFDGEPIPNPDEVSDWKWVTVGELAKDIETMPQNFTYWLKISLEKLVSAHLGSTRKD